MILKEHKRQGQEKMAMVRQICFWSVAAYLPKNTRVEDFWPMEGDGTPEERMKEFEEKALALIAATEKTYLENQKNLQQLSGKPS